MYTPSLNSSGFYLYDNTTHTYVPVSRSSSADGTTAFINPASPLTAGDSIILSVYYGQGLSGNSQVNTSYTFTASSTPDNNPPSVVITNPGNNESSLPINTQIQILFNKSVQFASLSLITLTGGPAVTLTPSLTNGDQTAILLPNAPLAPNTAYTLTIQAVASTAGVAMSSPVTVNFTTGPGVQLVGPAMTGIVPANGTTGVPVTVTATVTFSEPSNPLSASMANCPIGLSTVVCEVLIPLPGCATSRSYSFI
jgi:hypothetical protein